MATSNSKVQAPAPSSNLVAAWYALLGGPLAWVLDFGGRNLLTRTANRNDSAGFLWILTVIAMVIVIGAAATGYWLWRGLPQPLEASPRRRMAMWGLAFCAFFGLLILAQAFPTLILGPRDLT